jgi:hypothetical protein
VGTIGVKVWVYRGEVMRTGQLSGDRIAAEADLATGGPARRTQKSLKSRAEEAAGTEKKPRLIEAGGGKRLIEAGGGNKEGRRVIESSGARSPTAAEARVQYESAREEIDPEAEVVEVASDATAEAVDAAADAPEALAPDAADASVSDTADSTSATGDEPGAQDEEE